MSILQHLKPPTQLITSVPKKFPAPNIPTSFHTSIIIYPGSLDYRSFIRFVEIDLAKIPGFLTKAMLRLTVQLLSPTKNYKSEKKYHNLDQHDLLEQVMNYDPFIFQTDKLISVKDLKDVIMVFEIQTRFGKKITLGKCLIGLGGASSLWNEKKTHGGKLHARVFGNFLSPSDVIKDDEVMPPVVYHESEEEGDNDEESARLVVIADIHFEVSIFHSTKKFLQSPEKPYCNVFGTVDDGKSWETRIIGHRGLGMNRTAVDGKCGLQLGENTVLSMQTVI